MATGASGYLAEKIVKTNAESIIFSRFGGLFDPSEGFYVKSTVPTLALSKGDCGEEQIEVVAAWIEAQPLLDALYFGTWVQEGIRYVCVIPYFEDYLDASIASSLQEGENIFDFAKEGYV